MTVTTISRRKVEQDISKERSIILSCQPHLIALLFDLDHIAASSASKDRIANDPGMIACTDGKTVWYGEKYNGMRQSEKNYVCLHELLHGILQHPLRFQMLYLRYGYLMASLANYAADAIINESIDEDPYTGGGLVFAMPEEFPGVRMSTIHSIMKEAIDFAGKTPPETYDPKAKAGMQMEIMYGWLLWAYEAVKEAREKQGNCQGQQDGKGQKGQSGSGSGQGQGKGQKSDNTDGSGGQNSGDSDGEEEKPRGGSDEGREGQPGDGKTQIERIAGEDAWDIERAIEDLREALASGKTTDQLIGEIQDRMDNQREKIQQIVQGLKLQGHGKGSLMLTLAEDLPEPVIPWQHIIRRAIVSGVGIRMVDSYSRPSTVTLGQIGRGSRPVYRPGISIFDKRPRILNVLDVSGSHVSELPQCFSEVWNQAKLKDAAIDLVTFDDGVQEKLEIKDKRDFKRILERGIKGGGGTELLDDVFDEVRKMKHPYKMIIIMTDGYLTVGPPTRYKGFDILWVITPGGRGEHLEGIGKVVYLPDFMK